MRKKKQIIVEFGDKFWEIKKLKNYTKMQEINIEEVLIFDDEKQKIWYLDHCCSLEDLFRAIERKGNVQILDIPESMPYLEE